MCIGVSVYFAITFLPQMFYAFIVPGFRPPSAPPPHPPGELIPLAAPAARDAGCCFLSLDISRSGGGIVLHAPLPPAWVNPSHARRALYSVYTGGSLAVHLGYPLIFFSARHLLTSIKYEYLYPHLAYMCPPTHPLTHPRFLPLCATLRAWPIAGAPSWLVWFAKQIIRFCFRIGLCGPFFPPLEWYRRLISLFHFLRSEIGGVLMRLESYGVCWGACLLARI